MRLLPQLHRCYFASLFFLALGSCSGGGGQDSAPLPAASGQPSQLLGQISGQLARNNQAELTGFVIETDSLLLTQLEGASSLESFLAKNPIDDFEYLFESRTQHLKLVWLESEDGLNFFTPEPAESAHGRYFLWGHLSPPSAFDTAAEDSLNFSLLADVHCTTCQGNHFQMNGDLQINLSSKTGQFHLANQALSARLDSTIQLDKAGIFAAAGGTPPVIQFQGQALEAGSWQIMGGFFGEDIAEVGGGFALNTNQHHFTGAFIGGRADEN